MASEKDRDADVGASESEALSRRSFLFLTGAASCAAVTASAAAVAPDAEALSKEGVRVDKPHESASHALAENLSVGTRLHTSTIASVHPIKFGAVAIVLQRPDGGSFQLDVLRRSERDGSIAQSARYSVFAVNGGTGISATSEPDGLAAMALARTLAAAELGGMATVDLLTHADRARRHPAGAFRVAV